MVNKISILIWLLMGAFLIFAYVKISAFQNQATKSQPTVEYSHEFLGTLISISIYGDFEKGIFEKCFEAVEEIEKTMSMNSYGNEIWQLNNLSGISPVQVCSSLYEIIVISKEMSRISNGVFDISIGAVMELWKKDGVFCVLPDEESIAEKLALVDYNKIELLPDNYVFLEEKGMSLDLGGIAKGYACDVVMKIIAESSVEAAILDFGGNIYVYGSKADGRDWRVGIRSPLENSDICAVELSEGSLVTSGGYERFFEENEQIYSHILDTKTGFPARTNIVSATIIGESSTLADGLSTICFCMDLDKAMDFINSIDGYEGIFITDKMEVYATEGISENVYLYDDRFTLIVPKL